MVEVLFQNGLLTELEKSIHVYSFHTLGGGFEMVSIGQVCRILGIRLSTAYRWLQRGVIQEAYRKADGHRVHGVVF